VHRQAPLWQAWFAPHGVPGAASGFEQVPVVELHVPATWHASNAVHVTGFEPTHAPAWHVSSSVHASPSLHAVPDGHW
jgi:hypothetical protein